MAKKKIEVDEDMLKEIMVGDIPIFGREKQKENAPPPVETKTAEVVETPPEEKPPVAVQEKATVKPKKRKEDSFDYRKMFLTEGTVQHRQQTSDKRGNRETQKSQVALETQTEGWRFFWVYYADGIVRNNH